MWNLIFLCWPDDSLILPSSFAMKTERMGLMMTGIFVGIWPAFFNTINVYPTSSFEKILFLEV